MGAQQKKRAGTVALSSGMWRDPRTGIYSLRKRVPARFKGVAGRAGDVVKISTGTADRREAERRWPDVLRRYQAMQADWERRLNVVAVSPSRAAEVAALWAAWIAGDMRRLDRGGEPAGILDGEIGAMELRLLAELETPGANEDASANWDERALVRLRAHAAEAMALASVTVTADTEAVLIEALRPVASAAYRQAAMIEAGAAGATGVRFNPLRQARAALPAVPEHPKEDAAADAVTLTSLFEGWGRTAVVKPRTADETAYNVALLRKHVGHDDAARIDAAALRDWRDATLAAGRTNTTFNNRLSMVGAVLAWGVKEGRLASNPAVGLRLPKNRTRSPLPYDDDDAARILNAARRETKPSLRWAHWIMAWSGMRAGEVLQLTAGDVRCEGSVWFIAVHENDSGKTVKTGQPRNVPLHPALVAEGFVDYARSISGDRPLFPDKGLDRHGNRGGRAWNVVGVWVRQKVGLTDPRKAPDHSWRHRVEDELRAAEAPEDIRDALLGHARKTTGRHYGRRGEALTRLARFVALLPVPAGVE